jgi:hypothetical protein
MNSKIEIKNGQCFSSNGYRQVAISISGEIRPVLRAIYSGYLPDRCTVQAAEEGDYLFIEKWGKENFDEVKIVGSNVTLTLNETIAGWAVCPAQLKKWLERGKEDRQESYLPAGCGWNGRDTLMSNIKKERITRFFTRIPHPTPDKVLDEAMLSPGKNMPTSWAKAEPLPETLFSLLEVGYVSWDAWTEWVFWYSNGKVEHTILEATIGFDRSMAEKEEHTIMLRSPEKTMPKNVVKAMRINRGAYTKDGMNYGVSWELYKK